MIFVTGSNGFIGKILVKYLRMKNLSVLDGNRQLYGDLNTEINWMPFLKDVSTVVHCAARVHVMDEKSLNPLDEFRKINVEVTKQLAITAKKVGVKKFIYLSSVKVNGELSGDKPFSASDIANPTDAYGISKWEAERELLNLNDDSFQVIIIRPPLVYGLGVKANFEKLFWLVKKDLPIPFKAAKNKRSLVSVLNLSDLISHCIQCEKYIGGNVFLVSDGNDLSLSELILEMGKVLNKKPHLIYVPLVLFKIVFKLLNKKSYYDRLFGNLQVNIEKTQKILNWSPPFSFQKTFNDTSEIEF